MQPHDFWQELLPPEAAFAAPYTTAYPARLPDGRVLLLPIRPLADTGNAIASLILNQSAFAVEEALADLLAARLAPLAPDVLVGLPTLGLSLARLVAKRLGHARYVALGTSKKFWYDAALSVPLTSITSPGAAKTLYLDPRMRPLLQGRRVVLIDDVISSGASMRAGRDLMTLIEVVPVALGAAMLQTERWRDRLQPTPTHGAFTSPLLRRDGAGWRNATA